MVSVDGAASLVVRDERPRDGAHGTQSPVPDVRSVGLCQVGRPVYGNHIYFNLK
jgi:hypothetical protein